MDYTQEIKDIKERLDELEGKKKTISTSFMVGEKSDEPMSWDDAKKWCEDRGGRLPTLGELLLISEQDDAELLLIGEQDDDDFFYWSATEYGTKYVWRFRMSDGGVDYGNIKYIYSSNYVRCVFDE